MKQVIAWLPLLLLPASVIVGTPQTWPAWAFMWLLAVALFAGCKWLTWFTAAAWNAPLWLHLGYLFAWPGLDAPAFFSPPTPRGARPSLQAWLFAFGKLFLGLLFIFGVFPRLPAERELLRGWVAMIGIVFILHMGVFHLLSLFWQRLGVDAKPLMNWPALSQSVSEFWGQRWNTAFRDLTHRFLFRPLTARFGGRAAILLGFLFSGLVHELVISLPAHADYGGPTVFFLIQAVALFVDRSRLGRIVGLARGARGWIFTMLVLLAPIALLFHPPFVRTVVVPFVQTITASGGRKASGLYLQGPVKTGGLTASARRRRIEFL